MAYKKPGAYARFVRTVGGVNNPGSTKVMAIVGTGKLFFEQLNEARVRLAGSTTELLNKENVYEVYHVTSRPLKNGEVDLTNGGIEYTSTHFELKDGKHIAWKLADQPLSNKVAGVSDGSIEFEKVVNVSVDKDYLAKTGQYKIEITYIDKDTPGLGTYAVINNMTGEVLGEFQVGATPIIDVIPGFTLTVTDTMIPEVDGSGTAIPGTCITNTGDYVVIHTTAGNTVAGTPAPGEAFYVSYAYRKAEVDFAPKMFTDYQDIIAEYGDYEVTASGKVINSLALGAEIAFTNGVNPIVCVQTKNDSDYAIQRAIDALERDIKGVVNVNTVVPLSTSPAAGAHALNHVKKMSEPEIGKERMTYIASAPGELYTDSMATAAGLNDERAIYVVPGSATKQIRDTVTGRISVRRVPGCYLAVAVAALGLKNDPAEPFTNKTISGFDSLGEFYSESEKNLMAERGCLVLDQSGANIRIRHGQTTAVADINSNEITLVQIKDHVIEAARKTLGEQFIGRKLMPTVVNDIEVALTSLLTQFKGQDIIIGFHSVTVKRSKEDPRAIDVKFEIEAVYPLNYINIEFSFSGIN